MQSSQELYEIISERYERGSIIVTSNRAFEEWGDIFANDLLSSAALDRLTHHAHTLIIRGDSFRQRNRRKETINQEILPDSIWFLTPATFIFSGIHQEQR